MLAAIVCWRQPRVTDLVRCRGGGCSHLPGSVDARRAGAAWGIRRVARMLVAGELLESEHGALHTTEERGMPPPLPTPQRWCPRQGASCRTIETSACSSRVMYSIPSLTRSAQRELSRRRDRAGTAAVSTPPFRCGAASLADRTPVAHASSSNSSLPFRSRPQQQCGPRRAQITVGFDGSPYCSWGLLPSLPQRHA